MPLGTYDELKAGIGDWLNRADLTTVIPTFITMAEAECNRMLRLRDMLIRTTAPLNSQYTALPADCQELKNVQINNAVAGRPVVLGNAGSPEELDHLRERLYPTSGIPAVFCVHGGELEVAPTPSTEFEMEWSYYRKITPLSIIAPSNWLLTKHPDLYLYGALIHAAPYLKDDGRVAVWKDAYQGIIGSLRMEEDHAVLGGSAPRMRTPLLG